MANDKDRILLNLGVQVDQQQVVEEAKRIQNLVTEKVDGRLVIKANIDKKSQQELEGFINDFIALFDKVDAKKAIEPLRRGLANLKDDLTALQSGAKSGNTTAIYKRLRSIQQITAQMVVDQTKYNKTVTKTVNDTKKVTQANKESAKVAKEAEQAEKNKAKQIKKAADQKKKASQEEKEDTKETSNLTKQQEKQETEIVKQVQMEVDVRAKVNTELKETVSQLKEVSKLQENIKKNAEGTVITVANAGTQETAGATSTKTATNSAAQQNLANVFTGYKIGLQQLEQDIANAQKYKPQLQQLGMQGIEGDSRAAQENVYKAVEALKKMGKELQVDTGRALTDTNEIFDYIFKNINTQGKTLISNFQEGHLQGLTLNLQNAVKGSVTSVTSQITHVNQSVLDLARQTGASLEETLKAVEQIFDMDGLKVFYDYGGKEGKDTEIKDAKALRSIKDFDPAKLKIWSQSDTFTFNSFTKEINDSKPILKEYEEIWKSLNDAVRGHSREMTGLNRENVLNNYNQAIEGAEQRLKDLKQQAGNLVNVEDFDKIDKKYKSQRKAIEDRAETAKDEKIVKQQKKTWDKAYQDALSDYRGFLAQKEKARQQYEHQTTVGKVSTKFEDTNEGKAFEAELKAKEAAVYRYARSHEQAEIAIKGMHQAELDSGKHESTGLQNKTKQLDEYRRNAEEIAKLEKRATIAQMNADSQGMFVTGKQKSHYQEIADQLKAEIKLLEDRNKKIREALPDLKQETEEIDERLKKMKELAHNEASVDGSTRNSWGERFKNAFQRIFDYTISYRLIGMAQDALRSGYQYLQDYDEALTNLRIVTGETREETEKLMKTYNKLGQELGATTIEVAEAANDWLRQGYSAEESAELITASVRLSKLGMIETSEATEYLTSALRGYKLEVGEVIGVVDKLTAVDLKAAVSAGDLAVAMSRTASSAKMAGVDQNTLLGYLATVQEVTQKSAETVGESFKSIFSRFGNVKAGKFVDDETGESLNDIEKVLKKVGIALRSDNETFRETDEVLSEVAGKWSEYTDVERNAIATAIAGTRQRENFIVLMENWGKVLEYTGTAAASAGTSFKKYKAYMESFEGSVATLKATFQELVTTLVNSKELINVVQELTKVIESMNSWDWEGIKQATEIIAKIVVLAAGLKKIISMIGALATAISKLGGFAAAIKALFAGGAAAATAAGGLAAVLSAALPLVGIIAALGVAIAAMNGAFETTEHRIKEYTKAIEELNEKQKEEEKLFNQYEQLMAKSKTIYGLTAEEKENLKAISEELVNVYGLEASGIDNITGAYIISNKALDENIDKLKEQRRELLLNQKEERNKRIKQTTKDLKNKHKTSWGGLVNGDPTNLTQAEVDIIVEAYNQMVKESEEYKAKGRNKNDVYWRTTKNKNGGTITNYEYLQNILGDKGITDEHIQDLVVNAALSTVFDGDENDWTELKSKLRGAMSEYEANYDSLIQDVQDNIVSALYDMNVSGEAERFFRQVSADYIQTEHEAGTETSIIEQKLQDFFTQYADVLGTHGKKKDTIATRLSSSDVAISDYEDLIENNIEELAIIAKLYGEQSKKYKETMQAQEEVLSQSFGARIIDIRDKLGTKETKEELESFGNTVLQSANAYAKGTKSFEEYITSLNTAITNLKITETFKNNVEEMNNLLDLLRINAESELNNIVSQFKNGGMGIEDYLTNLSSLSTHFSTLSSEIEDSALVDPAIKSKLKGINAEIEETQKELKLLKQIIPLIGSSFESFTKISDKDIKTLTSALNDLGITGLKVGDNFYEGAANIVKAMQTTEEAWNEGQDAIEEKTRQTTGRVGALIGTVLDAISSQINGTTFGFEYKIGSNGLPELQMKMTSSTAAGLTELEKYAAREAGRGTYDSSTGTFSNDKNLTSEQLKKAIQRYEEIMDENLEETGTTIFGGYEIQLDPVTGEAQLVEKQRPLRTVKQGNANKIRISNMLADSGISTSSLFNFGGIVDSITDTSGESTTSELEKYYSVIFQDLLSAMLADKKEILEDFEKQNDKLNDELAHALELEDLGEVGSIYDTMEEFKKQYEKELEDQVAWAEDVVNNQIIPAINSLVPDFAITSAEDMTNLREQQIKYYFENQKNKIEQDLHYLEQLQDDDLSAANKKFYESQISNTAYLKDISNSIVLLEDEKNALEYTEQAVTTNIDTLKEFTDTIDDNNETLRSSRLDISNYTTALNGFIEKRTERITMLMDKNRISSEEATQALKDLYWQIQETFAPDSVEKADALADAMNDTLLKAFDNAKEHYNQIYSDAGVIKDYEVGLLEDEIDAINSKYEDQIAELENKRDIQQQTNDLIEAETRLRNAQKERNKRVYREGLGFVWEADQTEVDAARQELEDLKLDKQISDLEKAQEEEVKAVQESIDKWEEWYKTLTKQIDQVEVAHAQFRLGIEKDTENMYKAVTKVVDVYGQLKEAIDEAEVAEKNYNEFDPEDYQNDYEYNEAAEEQAEAAKEWNKALAKLNNYKLYLQNLKDENRIEVYDSEGKLDYSAQNGTYQWANETLYAVEQAEKAIRNGDEELLRWAKTVLEDSADELVDNLYKTKKALENAEDNLIDAEKKRFNSLMDNDDYNTDKVRSKLEDIEDHALTTNEILQDQYYGTQAATNAATNKNTNSNTYDDYDTYEEEEYEEPVYKKEQSSGASASIGAAQSGEIRTYYSDGCYTSNLKEGLYRDGYGKVGDAPSPNATITEVVEYNAKGNKNFQGGLSMVGEQGAELTVLPRGTGILPNPITENLWAFGQNPAVFLDRVRLSSLKADMKNTQNGTASNDTYVDIQNINLPNVGNAKQFVQELKSAVRRNTK